MPAETAADIASMFDADEFAEGAVYQSPAPGTDPVPCLVILDRGQGRSRFRAGQQELSGSNRHLWALAGDDDGQIADVRRDGLFTIEADGEVLKVQGMPVLDHGGALWSVQLLVVD